jgi:hypothetical protein
MPQVKFTNAKGLYQQSGRGCVGLRAVPELLVDQGAAQAIRSALTVDESGKIFLVPALTSDTQTLALPAPTNDCLGVTYTFVAVATTAQIFNVTTDDSNTKILAVKPKGDGDNTAISQGYVSIGFKAAAVLGSQFTITCVSTTVAHAWVASNVVDGLALNVGSINLA